jgi:hypothetical protein
MLAAAVHASVVAGCVCVCNSACVRVRVCVVRGGGGARVDADRRAAKKQCGWDGMRRVVVWLSREGMG